MKKVRLSVAVALVAVLVVSVWAGYLRYPFGTLNGIIAVGQKTTVTSTACVTPTNASNSYLTNVTNIKGLVASSCSPTIQCRVLMYQQGTTGLSLIGSVIVPCGTSFSTSPKTITLPANTYPANKVYCFAGEVTLLNAATGLCGISYTSGEATLNWTP